MVINVTLNKEFIFIYKLNGPKMSSNDREGMSMISETVISGCLSFTDHIPTTNQNA